MDDTEKRLLQERLDHHEKIITQLLDMLATTNRNMKRLLQEQQVLRNLGKSTSSNHMPPH